jgi:hypothetical protein
LLNYYKWRNGQKFGGTQKYFGGTYVEKHWFERETGRQTERQRDRDHDK